MILGSRGNHKIEQKATTIILSIEYKKAGFNLITFGSDDLVRTYNKMMQHFYQETSETDPNFTTNTMRVFCDFLLAVRRDLNDPNTKLKRSETLGFLVKGIDSLALD